MLAAKHRYSLSETSFILLLLLLVLWPALSVKGLPLVLLHFTSLAGLYLLLRQLADRLHTVAGHLLFGAMSLILIAELAIQTITGLHLNRFVLSLLLEPQAMAQIGLSRPGLAAVLVAAATLPSLILWYARRPALRLDGSIPVLLLAGSAMAAQLLYALMFHFGSTAAVETRRLMPFFETPHPYQSRRALAWLFGESEDNPFALADKAPVPAAPGKAGPDIRLARPLNILLVVSDSLRAEDIRHDPSLAPKLMHWAETGWLRLDHYSTSNCTQFSFYSMLTGKLPTGFGNARRGRAVDALPGRLRRLGYRLTSTEQISLDWYDTAAILLDGTDRTIVASGDGLGNVEAVTDKTLALLSGPLERPFFHLAYYSGTHYPYSTQWSGNGHEQYLASIRQFDSELGRLLAGLQAAGRLSDTLVIVTSDHGEQFVGTSQAGHASRLTDAQTQVPFLVLGGPEAPVRSHQDLSPYIASVLEGRAMVPSGPVILANCDYAYPNGFAVLLPDGRADFAYDDGLLVPVHGPEGTMPGRHTVLRAGASLLAAIERD